MEQNAAVQIEPVSTGRKSFLDEWAIMKWYHIIFL